MNSISIKALMENSFNYTKQHGVQQTDALSSKSQIHWATS